MTHTENAPARRRMRVTLAEDEFTTLVSHSRLGRVVSASFGPSGVWISHTEGEPLTWEMWMVAAMRNLLPGGPTERAALAETIDTWSGEAPALLTDLAAAYDRKVAALAAGRGVADVIAGGA